MGIGNFLENIKILIRVILKDPFKKTLEIRSNETGSGKVET